jgi:hypothetical protein
VKYIKITGFIAAVFFLTFITACSSGYEPNGNPWRIPAETQPFLGKR